VKKEYKTKINIAENDTLVSSGREKDALSGI
jgi:hypothetical protein